MHFLFSPYITIEQLSDADKCVLLYLETAESYLIDTLFCGKGFHKAVEEFIYSIFKNRTYKPQNSKAFNLAQVCSSRYLMERIWPSMRELGSYKNWKYDEFLNNETIDILYCETSEVTKTDLQTQIWLLVITHILMKI